MRMPLPPGVTEMKRNPGDLYREPGPTSHYCKITVTEKAQVFEMIKLDEKTGTWMVADTFMIPLPQ